MGLVKKYSLEVDFIMQSLDDICEERYFERGTGDAKASTIGKNIKRQLIELLVKIEEGKPSIGEEFFAPKEG